ncbi:hypothetical protein KCU59_g161, partial [Aureobasidium melanogenum]
MIHSYRVLGLAKRASTTSRRTEKQQQHHDRSLFALLPASPFTIESFTHRCNRTTRHQACTDSDALPMPLPNDQHVVNVISRA